jgi:hypothetical protein
MRFIIQNALLVIVGGLAIAGCSTDRDAPRPEFALRQGDLLFQDLDCGPLCDAIETVTRGVDGAHFSHIGIVLRVDGEPVILEAVSAGVLETPLAEFLARSADERGRPKVLVGRLEGRYRPLIPDALSVAQKFIALPYDSVYVIDNASFYCSELVYEAFRQANAGSPIFPLAPMTFQDPKTGQTFGPWAAYYEELGVPIPEGKPGLNPGGISQSPDLRIVHAYGRPTGWRGRVQNVN